MTAPQTEFPTGGQVTIADLFRVLTSIQSNLAAVTTKLEVIDSRNTVSDNTHQDHELRLRGLERAYQRIYGAAITIGTAAGIISGWLTGTHAH